MSRKKGFKTSEKTKELISISMRGEKNHFYGKKHTTLSRKKISLSGLGNKKWLGKKHTEETKQKISDFFKGRKRKPQTIETRIKISNSLIGEKHPNWKGGSINENEKLRKSLEFKIWRELVFKRDNYTCQKTKKNSNKLHPHHIKNFSQFPELRFSLENGITLTEEAHFEFHKKYGFSNNNEEQLKEFLENNIQDYETHKKQHPNRAV